jgi:hypothetical protein
VFFGYFVVLGAYWVAWAFIDQVSDGHVVLAMGWALAALALLASVPLTRIIVLRARPTWRRAALLLATGVGAWVGFVLYVAAFIAIGWPWDW